MRMCHWSMYPMWKMCRPIPICGLIHPGCAAWCPSSKSVHGEWCKSLTIKVVDLLLIFCNCFRFLHRNGKLLTGGHLKMNGMFDPITSNLDFNFSCPGFHLIGDYTANLEVLDPYGPGTVLHGDGHVDLTYNGYGLREATYKAFFHPGLRKYQTEYPSYDLKLDSVVGEVTGLRRVADNSTIDLDQALKLFHSLEQPMLVEFYRSLGNHHVQV